jgi:hypothetical protein
MVRPAAQGAQAGGTARHAGLHQDNVPVLVARDRKGATFDAVLPQAESASVEAALAGVVTPGNHLIGDGGKAIAAFARNCLPWPMPWPGKPTPEAPRLHINNVNAYHGHLKQWLARFNGVATKNLPSHLGWRRALEAWGNHLAPQTWGKGAIANGPCQQLVLTKRLPIGFLAISASRGFRVSSRPVHRLEDLRLDLAF